MSREVLDDVLDVISSSVGSLTNPSKIADTFKSVKKLNVTDDTIAKYLDYFTDAFLIAKAKRYDIKGRKYIGSPLEFPPDGREPYNGEYYLQRACKAGI